MHIEKLLHQLQQVRRTPRGHTARCPAHIDKTPSLSVSEGERGILIKCWAGCTLQAICQTLGIREADLFFDASVPRGQRPTPKPAKKVDRVKLAFRFELAALDFRLRSDRILTASRDLSPDMLTDADLDRALSHVAQAYGDQERAELFEGVADDLRLKDYTERKTL